MIEKMGQQIDIFGQVVKDPARSMSDFFIVPPFSIIDTTTAEWKNRKRRWDAMIKDKGETRENTLFKDSGMHDYDYFRNKKKVEIKLGREITKEEYYSEHYTAALKSVSILDACLAEICCKWFANPGFHALDPFAGDSVFGYVSTYSGLGFTGIELRKEQAELNQQRLNEAGLAGKYINDTSANMDAHIADKSIDMVFSCPPYLWLEQYSDDERDLSTMSEDQFFDVFGGIMTSTFKKLKDNRFAVLVISEVRDKKTGRYVGFIPRTIQLMTAAGYLYYNDVILMNSAGTLPMRAGKAMNASRKVGRRHQNVLVFYKGDPNKIKDIYPEIIPKNTYYDEVS